VVVHVTKAFQLHQTQDCTGILRADRQDGVQTVSTRQPRFVLANRQPSVVAIGIVYILPSNWSGPTTPTGTGM